MSVPLHRYLALTGTPLKLEIRAMHFARAFVAALVLFPVALAACSAPASMASSDAPVVAAIIVKPRIATSDSVEVLRPIQAALGETAGVRYVRPMAGDAHLVHLTAPAQRADVPKLVERVRASGNFDYVEVDSMVKIK